MGPQHVTLRQRGVRVHPRKITQWCNQAESGVRVQDMAQQQRLQSGGNMDDNLAHNIAAEARYKCVALPSAAACGLSASRSVTGLSPRAWGPRLAVFLIMQDNPEL